MSEKMTGEEFRRRYAAGQRDFSGVDLSEANIGGDEYIGSIGKRIQSQSRLGTAHRPCTAKEIRT
jgi:hypothetical protein